MGVNYQLPRVNVTPVTETKLSGKHATGTLQRVACDNNKGACATPMGDNDARLRPFGTYGLMLRSRFSAT